MNDLNEVNNEYEISIEEIFSIIFRNKYKILLSIIIASIVGFVFTKMIIEPEYKSHTSMMVFANHDDKDLSTGDLTLASTLADQYAELMLTNSIIEQVITDLELDYTVKQVTEMVAVSVSEDTALISVDVTSTDAVVSKNIAEYITSIFVNDTTPESLFGDFRIDNITIVLVDEAEVNNNPVSPNMLLNIIISIIIGGLIGVGIAFVRYYFDRTVKSASEIQKITNLNVIGEFPVFNEQHIKEGNGEHEIVSLVNSNSVYTEKYRNLRTNIELSNIDIDIRTILVTSANPGDTKSTTASNLAAVYALAGKKTLLIDLDLRKPVVHRFMNLRNKTGITEFVYEDCDLKDIINNKSTNLDVITAGKENQFPSEFLMSKKFKLKFDEIIENYDMVIVDSPPLGLVTDSAILAQYVDATVLVASINNTNRDILSKVTEQLNQNGANLFGVVISKIPVLRHKQHHYYQYYESNTKGSKK